MNLILKGITRDMVEKGLIMKFLESYNIIRHTETIKHKESGIELSVEVSQ